MRPLGTQPSSTMLEAKESLPRILVVDDEQHMCDVCSRALKRSGYDVVSTTDPNVAAQILYGPEQFDLLLTDIKMPTMSGLELAHIARECDPAISIIIMTGFASIENLHQSVQRGVAEFLSKPFELEQLRIAVEQALHKRTLLQDNLRLRALEHLHANSKLLSATLDLAELTRILLRVTLQQSGCRAGFVLLAEGEQPLQEVAASTSDGQLLKPGHALARRAFAQQQNLSGNEAIYCRIDNQNLQYAQVVPLRAQGDINGLLLLCDDKAITLSPAVQEEIVLLANYAGAALRNASLYGQLGEAYQRLQEVDRLKSEFISIASHELRTPLSIVLGYTMMLRDQNEGEQREYLQRVMDNAQRIKDIVDDMVNLRHLETGEASLALERCDLQEIVEQSIGQIRTAAQSRQHEIRIDLATPTMAFQCDREKLLLILSHLLANAIRFTPEGGCITVRTELRPPGELLDGAGRSVTPRTADETTPWLVIEVRDTGIGIPEREQVRIFDRFYQVADSLTRDHGGTGLGLAIVRELIHTLDGAVWVTSKEGEGSIFAFALPYRQDEILAAR